MKKFIFAAVLPVLHIFGVIDASAAIPYFTDEAVRSVDRSTVQSEGKALLDELGRELPAYENQRGTRPFFCAGWSFCAGGWNCLNAIWKRQILRS